MSQDTQPIRIETGKEVAFELSEPPLSGDGQAAASTNSPPANAGGSDTYLFIECAKAVYDGER